MESNIPSLEQSDLDKLNDKDKAELRQFITNEQQRTRIQARKHFFFFTFPPTSSLCWLFVCGSSGILKLEEGC